jgi:hypothetical protein
MDGRPVVADSGDGVAIEERSLVGMATETRARTNLEAGDLSRLCRGHGLQGRNNLAEICLRGPADGTMVGSD